MIKEIQRALHILAKDHAIFESFVEVRPNRPTDNSLDPHSEIEIEKRMKNENDSEMKYSQQRGKFEAT